MSLSLLNELRVGLCPDRLVVAHFERELRRKLARYEVREVTGKPIDAMKELPRARIISVVLSNQFVRYAVLPWSAALKTGGEWDAFAAHAFTSTYGDRAKDWAIRVCTTGRDQPAVACAVDRALVESLRAVPGVVSVQPHLMAAFNAARARMTESSFWFVVQEPARLTFSLVHAGRWRLIRNRQAPQTWRNELEDLLEREAAAHPDARTDCAAVCGEEPPPARAGCYRFLDVALPSNADPALRPIRMVLSS